MAELASDLVAIPLLPGFRFAHEPLGSQQTARFVGRESELQALAQRIFFSTGGSFLITGYRGVGKTSFVNHVIGRVRTLAEGAEAAVGSVEIVDIHLNIARPLTPAELMHHIVRRLYQELVDRGLFEQLPVAVRNDVILAYRRTSMSITNKIVDTIGREYGVTEAGVGGPLLRATAKFMMKRSEIHTRDDAFAFLAYDDKAAENDVLRIARQLTLGFTPQLSFIRRLWNHLRANEPRRTYVKVVFVFDELDKIDEESTSETKAKPFLDQLLADLKNLFTTSGLSFVFVAGKDLYDRWLMDVGRGDSIYESVFCYDRYLPCMWSDVEKVCTSFIDEADGGNLNVREAFFAFLKYRGRGIPRRIIREFNEYVRWDGSRLALFFTADDIRRFRFFAELQTALESDDSGQFSPATTGAAATENDKARLAAYYINDWVLAHGNVPFSAEEAVAVSRSLSAKIAPTVELATTSVGAILSLLVNHEFLETVGSDIESTMADGSSRRLRYRLTSRRKSELGHFAAVYGNDKPADVAAVRVLGDYRLLDDIGAGGYGTVYRAQHLRSGRVVAVKVLARELTSNATTRARFVREAQFLQKLRHPNIVEFVEFLDIDDTLALAMEYVDGISLRRLLDIRGPITFAEAKEIVRGFSHALAYLHRNNIVRVDLKPANVLLSRDGRIFLSDLGISKLFEKEDDSRDSITREGALIGTPVYMAPEQFTGKVDARSDIWSVGVVLYEMLAGRAPFQSDSVHALLMQILSTPAPSLSISPLIDALVAKCLAKSADERFRTVEEFLEALEGITASPVDLRSFVSQSIDQRESLQKQNDAVTGEYVAPDLSKATAATNIPVPASETSRGHTEAGEMPLPAEVTGPRLQILEPPNLASSEFPLSTSGNTTIGRGSNVDINLLDPSVTRFHARIVQTDDTFVVEDLNTTNGTYLNDQRLDRNPMPLKQGDLLRMGLVVAIFVR